MELTDYRNEDGTYTSPTTGKIFKSEKALRSHLAFKRSDKAFDFKKVNSQRVSCRFCDRELGVPNVKNHEKNCYLNPSNIVLCQVCNKPIKNFRVNKATCSRSCANVYFRSGEKNGNWKQDCYQSTCFLHHKKECVVCGEVNIVAVHHLDEDHSNNDPANLVPLCPTHHQYWHSKFRSLIEQQVVDYINNWKILRMA